MAGTIPNADYLSGHGQHGAPLPAAPSSSSPLQPPPPPSSLQQPAFPSSMAWAPSPWQQPVPSSLPPPLQQPAGSASFWHDPWQPQQHDAVTPELESFGQFDDAILSDPMFLDLLPAAALEQPAIPQHDAFLTPEYLESGYDHLDDPSFFHAMTHDLLPPSSEQPAIMQMQMQPDTQTTPFFLNHRLELGAPAMAMTMQGLTDQNGYYWGQGPWHWQPSAAAAEDPAVHAAPPLSAELPDVPPPAEPANPPTGRRPRGRPRGSTAAKSRSKAKAKPKSKLATTAAAATPEPCQEHPMSTEQPEIAVAGEEEEAVGGTSGEGAQQQEEEEEDEAVEYADTNLPGVRFQPTDEEIIGYLRRKYHGRRMPADIVRDFNVFQDHPSTVKENFGDSIDGAWYVFSPRDRKYSKGKRPSRSVYKGNHKLGYWKSNTKEEKIIVRGKVIGSVNNLTFTLGNQPNGKPTPWKIREYRIPDFQRELIGPKQRYRKERNLDPHPTPLDDWVIYKLFYNERKAKQEVPVNVENRQNGEVGQDVDEERDDKDEDASVVDVEDQQDGEVGQDVDEEDDDEDASDGNPLSDGHEDYFNYLEEEAGCIL